MALSILHEAIRALLVVAAVGRGMVTEVGPELRTGTKLESRS